VGHDVAKRKQQSQYESWAQHRDVDPGLVRAAAKQARDRLAQQTPLLSAKFPAGRLFVGVMLAHLALTLVGAFDSRWLSPLWLFNSAIFAGVGIVRAVACFIPHHVSQTLPRRIAPQAAPVWTILIALYKEADSIAPLLTSLSKLDWRTKNLDVIFACEADDEATLIALKRHQNLCNFRVVIVPPGGPRTKPNALQTALPFAKGRFLTVYDAEDRPDPNQLRAAFDAFVTGSKNLAVVQAPLVTWNQSESWIAQQFALDYAIWFRVMLPAFARLSGLIPLGGTSNHFRTDILRKVGGWDPYNVTEDADLGVRLARNGYKAALISPPTWEEAPPKISAWVKQRGRWIQGHMQTFSLHMRTPRELAKELGLNGMVSFMLGLGAGPMSALISLPFLVSMFARIDMSAGYDVFLPLGLGLAGNVLAAVVACQRDGRWSLMANVVTMPFYFALQSLAACRAMWRVVFTPFFWDKTDHGCAARAPYRRGFRAWIGMQPLSPSS
jgi:glycosyltransferase XagB